MYINLVIAWILMVLFVIGIIYFFFAICIGSFEIMTWSQTQRGWYVALSALFGLGAASNIFDTKK